MQSLLNGEQMQQYEDQWQSAQDYKQSIVDGRSELGSYTEKLKIADAIWSRYENTKEANQKRETEYAAESAYESALERLEELLSIDSAIEIYLDRPVCFEHGEEPGISACAVPRYRLSTSHHATPEPFLTKDVIKADIIGDAIKMLSNNDKLRAVTTPSSLSETIAAVRKIRRSR